MGEVALERLDQGKLLGITVSSQVLVGEIGSVPVCFGAFLGLFCQPLS